MNAARAYRRLKEVEEQKMANRLALLQLELDRSKKKVGETMDRTKAIQDHRNKILTRYQERLAEQKQREEELTLHTELNQKARDRMTTLRRANVLQVHQTKREEATVVKDESTRNEQMIERQRRLEIERAAEVKRLIREQRLSGQQAREDEMARKRDEARLEFQRRVEDEAQRSKASEGKVESMETLELELIAQLDKAQEEQRLAYQALEEALIMSKQTIMSTSRATLKEAIVDSGQVRRPSPKTTPRRTNGSSSQRSARARKIPSPDASDGRPQTAGDRGGNRYQENEGLSVMLTD